MDPQQLRKIIREELEPVKKTQQEHSRILKGHSKLLASHSKDLGNIKKDLSDVKEDVDTIKAELHQVHQLADVTLDVVKGRYEKNKREIDEIKDHLGLPKEPYFGD